MPKSSSVWQQVQKRIRNTTLKSGSAFHLVVLWIVKDCVWSGEMDFFQFYILAFVLFCKKWYYSHLSIAIHNFTCILQLIQKHKFSIAGCTFYLWLSACQILFSFWGWVISLVHDVREPGELMRYNDTRTKCSYSLSNQLILVYVTYPNMTSSQDMLISE